ncbi:disease resistance protein RGA2-like [Oryza brachyantha]|uniref:Uncharacterized protein n=1 Tax=Oryza brachyantha TaxID=4533 RepID=J3N6T7_ORYBR|nr:disease resistance protein RGA2-like [Oryza brachyantha]
MAAVGGMLTGAVLTMVSKQIGSAIGGQVKLHWDFDEDLENMKMTLETLEAFLSDAERRSVAEESVRLWLKRLKNAVYDISDMIEVFQANTTRGSKIMIPCLAIGPNIEMAKQMKRMRDKLENIAKQHNNFSFMSESYSNRQQLLYSERRTSPKVEEAAIVGMTQEKQNILDCLSDNLLTQDFIILAIYGMGGIGKTTLAQLVFKDKRFKEYSQVWVYVSQDFDLDKIESSIISQLSKREPSMTTDLEMATPDMKIIIVLDDLWENNGFKLDNLKLRLNVGKGAKVIVIVTTREEGIARRFSTVTPYLLKPLSYEMCWELIKQKCAFKDRDDKEWLESIGIEIARKCGGVALAALSLGYMLHSKGVDEWESVRDSNILNEPTSDDVSSPYHVLASLKLSYVRMKPCLKMCFGYCAIFPKGQKMVKDDLILQWISLDFIEPSKVYSPRQIGEIYVTELLGMSFLQHYSKSSSSVTAHEGNVTLLTMHDLVHDLARSVMVDEILVSSEQDKNGKSSYRYALLNDSSKPLKSFTKFPAKIRALRFVDCAKSVLHDGAFSGAKYLRVLDLSECSVQKLPDSVGDLRQLRYLSAPGIQDTMIPGCITKLPKLIYLNLSGSSMLFSLPESIGEMGSLMYLDLSGCSGIQRVPQSFGKLNLSYLDLSNCSSLKGVSEILGNLTKLQHLNLSYCQYVEKLGNLGNLTKLRYFHFSSSGSPGVSEKDVFGGGTKLEYLNLSTEFTDTKIKRLPEAVGSFIKLKYLNLSGWTELEELPRSWGALQNLIHLDLSNCYKIKGVPETLGSLTKLQNLNLSYCCCYRETRCQLIGLEEVVGKLTALRNLYLSKCLDTLFFGIKGKYRDEQMEMYTSELVCQNFLASLSSLTNLEELDLSDNLSIKTLPESIGDLENLHTLNLSSCDGLCQLPRVMREMESLKHLNVSSCYHLDKSTVPKFDSSAVLLPHFVVQAWDRESSSNVFLLQDVNTTELEISKLENVVSVKEAQRIRLKEKEIISELSLSWTRDARRFVEDQNVLAELEPSGQLYEFKLQGYSSAAFPDWLMDVASHRFPWLKSIDLVDLPNCTCLPPLGQLQQLETLSLDGLNGITKIDGQFCGGSSGAFHRLKSFSMSNMEGLEEWRTRYSSSGNGRCTRKFMFPRLKKLKIHHCPKLSLRSRPPKAVHWEIEGSDNVISSWPRASASSSSAVPIYKLIIKSCRLPLHQWSLLQRLTIKSLVIESCSDLNSSSPEIAQALSCSLQELFLKWDDDNPELPSWMSMLTHLNSLHISTRCPELKVSGGVMKQLSSLRLLTLHECAAMASLPEWLGELPSLCELRIEKCPRLNNLKRAMDDRRLTSIRSLHVKSCESISVLPESLGELMSLEVLHIDGCISIKSLPKSIQKLTNLVSVRVHSSPELEKWCELEENKNRFSHLLNKHDDCDYNHGTG